MSDKKNSKAYAQYLCGIITEAQYHEIVSGGPPVTINEAAVELMNAYVGITPADFLVIAPRNSGRSIKIQLNYDQVSDINWQLANLQQLDDNMTPADRRKLKMDSINKTKR